MDVIRRSKYQEIEQHLENHGSFNRKDTKDNIGGYHRFYLIELVECEFWQLVFLQNDEVLDIAPLDRDRRLSAVAERALLLGGGRLSHNWNLDCILKRARELVVGADGFQMASLVLRDLKGNEDECTPAFKYIHDGCHRCLGYAMLIQLKEACYQPLQAYLATEDELV